MRRMEFLDRKENEKFKNRQLTAEYARLYHSLSSKNMEFKRMVSIKKLLGGGGD